MQKIIVGDWVISSLSDGCFDLDLNAFVGVDPIFLKQELSQARMETRDHLKVQTEVFGYLIDTGQELILIDTGGGTRFIGQTGRLLGSLRQIGYEAQDISYVFLTHLHPDHMGGLLTTEGACLFSQATVCLARVEADYWCNLNQEAVAAPLNRPCFALARQMLAPYEARQRLRLFDDEQIISGITPLKTPGHTPGHTSFLVCHQSECLLIWGDIAHNFFLQLKMSELALDFDIDSQQAIVTRKDLLARAADEHLLVGGAHAPVPGFGHVLRNVESFSWRPFVC